MKNSFDYIFKDTGFSKELEEELEKTFSYKKVKKRETLLRANNYVNKLFFVVDGCLRSFYQDEEAREHTLHFATDNAAITDFAALYNKKPSSLSVECVVDSVIIVSVSSELIKLSFNFNSFKALPISFTFEL